MKNVVFKAISFVENGDISHGHYFYDITLSEAIAKMIEQGLNPILNIKVSIACYYW
jgi:hypothetical protein